MPLRSLFNLSFRYKIPLWGSVLIVTTAVITSTALFLHSYDDVKRDMLRNATSQGQILAKTLVPVLLQDHVWQAYEIINAPLHGATRENAIQADTLLVLDAQRQVYVSTRPLRLPMLADFARRSGEYALVAASIAKMGAETRVIAPVASDYLYVATPIMDEQTRLGTLIQIYAKKILWPRFIASAGQLSWVVLLVLAVLLPINWYWGQRTAMPLLRLTERMEQLGHGLPDELPAKIYDYEDELGRLFQAYNRTLQQLREKALIEGEIIHSERLVAIGRLAAGIAHEINNPLLGMLTSINTLRHHGAPDARTSKTLTLLERGLTQITETVAALLVEAKVNSRDFAPQDIDDVQTLIAPQANKRRVTIAWTAGLREPVPLPSTLVRQVMINLILNAVQASEEGGGVEAAVAPSGSVLLFEVINGGRSLSDSQTEHLFEPFTNADENGRGLGLWVCYQIVKQLGGAIAVDSAMAAGAGRTRFEVTLPFATR